MPTIRGQAMTTWTDWLGGQAQRVRLLEPRSRKELVDFLSARSDLATLKIHAVGSGHSTSDAARPMQDGFCVRVEQLALDFVAEAERWLKPLSSATHPPLLPSATLRRVAAGTTVKQLNAALDAEGLAVLSLGSYDAQTISGAVSTGTHGSSMACGPICDFVASIELVTVEKDAQGKARVASYRVEPAGGITDPAKFAADEALHGMKLIQEDDAFYSAVVGLGAFGVVTALTLQVVPAFWLREWREVMTWSELARELPQTSQRMYCDFILTPLPIMDTAGREHRVLLSTRVPDAPGPSPAPPRNDARTASLESQMKRLGSREAVTQYLVNLGIAAPLVANLTAYETAFVDEAKLKPHDAKWKSKSPIVFRTSVGDYIDATSAEIAVPIERAKDAVDAVIAHLAELRQGNFTGLYHLSPVGIRFQRGSRHYLAQQYGRDTCTIEAPIMIGTRRKGDPPSASPATIVAILQHFQESVRKVVPEARPHLGQMWWTQPGVGGAPSWPHVNYPKLAAWRTQMRRFNPLGVFDNDFTHRL